MMKVNKNRRTYILKMILERKYFYFAGYILGIICVLLSKVLGSAIHMDDIIFVPFSTSFPFGHILYLYIKERDRLIKEGRSLVLSKEALTNLGLGFASMIVLGLLCKIIQYLFGVIW